MNISVLSNSKGYNMPGRGILYAIISCMVFLSVSCTDNSMNTSEQNNKGEATHYSYRINAFDILSSNPKIGNKAFINKKIHAKRGNKDNVNNADGFSSPLFGLATAPNNDILVADASSGVVTLWGVTDIMLPGITDISTLGRGSMWATVGGGEDPESDSGQGLFQLSKGHIHKVANLFEFEETNDPDGAGADSNPFDVASLGGQAALVADAGANDLLRVDNQGHVKVLAVFPDEVVSTDNLHDLVGCPDNPIPDFAGLCDVDQLPAQAVPTSIAIGPDGYYYVGELKGFPAPTGASSIWKIAPGASWAECGSSPDCQKVFDGGFTSIIDLAFDKDGYLYVSELDEDSWFAVEVLGSGSGGTINKCNLATLTCEEVITGVPIHTAITFGKDGSLWATKNALIPNLAEVIKVP